VSGGWLDVVSIGLWYGSAWTPRINSDTRNCLF